MEDERTVILCGENPFFRDTLAPVIRDVGWSVVTASNASELDAALASGPRGGTLVALDLASSNPDPAPTARRLHNEPEPQPPVIALRSGDEPAEAISELKRAGISWFFDASVAKHEILYALKTLFNPQAVERRRHPRAPTQLPVEYWAGSDPHRKGTIRDLSEGGTFIECEDRYILGAEIKVRFTLAEGSTLEVDAEVVFTSPRMQRQTALIPGIGVKFRDLDDATVATIRDHITRVLKRMPDLYDKSMIGLKERGG